ncbi:beta strand repeat-containing protein [Thauera aromatica]|uniref:beta strand repeat-containing protein n=1 Tax=Thauera aromatica TaxID=59405 RepID=UPI001FFDA9BE|nr:hypothetical protein [Thauera aromatica]
MDNIVGTAGNDTINGVADGVTTTTVGAGQPVTQTFGGLDVVDGGAGVDTLNLTNDVGTMILATSVTVSGVENLNLRSAQNDITADVQAWSGLDAITVDQRGSAETIDIDTKSNVTSVIVTAGATATAPVEGVAIDDNGSAATTADTLASVSVTGAKGAVGVNSDALTSLTLADSAVLATVTNTTVGHTLNVTANNQSGAAGVTDAAATTVNVTATGANSTAFAVTAAAADAINFAGDKNLTATLGAQKAGLKITSATEGTLTIGTALNNDVTFTGGAGNETITLSNANTKAIVMGAGDDRVNVNGTVLGANGTIDGGDGVDTIAMSAANAATLSAAATYEARISNFEKVGLGQVVAFANNTVNLANLDDISYVVSAGTAPGTGVAETAAFTFEALKSGQSVTFAGRSVLAVDDLTAAQVASAFSTGVNTASATVGGTLDTEYDTTAPSLSDATVTIVREVVGNDAPNVTAAYANAAAPTAPVAALATNGADAITAVREVATLTLTSALVANTETVIIGDGTVSFTYTSGGDVVSTGGALAAAIVAAANGTSAFAARYTAAASGDNVVFTEVAPGTDSADLALDATSTGLTAADTYNFAVTTQGVTGAAAVAEVADVTFSGLLSGQSATIGGRTITALDDLTAAQVADTYFGGVNTATAQISGTLTGYTLTNTTSGDAVVRFTNATAGDATLITGTAAVAALPTVDAGELVITDGNTTAGGGNLTLTNVANAGTVELTGNNNGAITVTMKDATGAADSLNLKLNGAANLMGGVVNVAGVETIAIEATDSSADTVTVTNPTAASALALNAAAATSITLTGNHGVNFTGSTLTNVTSLDASGVVANVNTTGLTAAQIVTANGAAGAVTFTTAVADKDVTITTGNGNDAINAATVGTAAGVTAKATISTGAGADTITGGADADVIDAGSEHDVVVSSTGADTITLGEGNDVFMLSSNTHSVLATFDTITDFNANTYGQGTSGAADADGANATVANLTGDTISVSTLFSGAVDGIKVFVASNAADAQTFIQNTANVSTGAAANYTGFALDSSSNLLYMDFNQDGAIDSVVKLTGVTTITEAAFVTGFNNL